MIFHKRSFFSEERQFASRIDYSTPGILRRLVAVCTPSLPDFAHARKASYGKTYSRLSRKQTGKHSWRRFYRSKAPREAAQEIFRVSQGRTTSAGTQREYHNQYIVDVLLGHPLPLPTRKIPPIRGG